MSESPSETPPPVHRILEALLFVGGSPLTFEKAKQIIRGLTQDQFQESLTQLERDYRKQNRPYHIEHKAKGVALTLKPKYHSVQTRLLGGMKEARLSPPAIDALAIVAYRQPVSRSEVDSVRGGDSGSLLRQLVRRGLIHVMPSEEKGKEPTYGTTARFLEMFSLTSLDDLPRTQDLQQI